jgi:penicillin-binding protein 1A
MLQAGVLIVNPQNGDVLTWIGGNNFRFLPYDLIHAKRQAASAFKPILYATALEQGYSPCDYLDNEEHDFEEYPNWKPKNYDGESGGEVAMWYALAHSMNLPTVDLYRRVGHRDLDYVSRKLGFSSELAEGPASALGTMEVSLWELVRAYSSFAAKGKTPQQNMILEIRNSEDKIIYKSPTVNKKQAISESVSEQMNLMLLNATQTGTGRALYSRYGVRHEFAGKTGTSQNYSDARYVCYNSDMVIAIWVGASDPNIHFNNGSMGSGSRLALPIAGKTLQKAQKDAKLRGLFTAPVIPQDTSGMMDCQATREKSAGREIWQKMVDIVSADKKSVREKDSLQEHKTEASDSTQNKSGTKVGRFLKNIFGKKE